jgi:two-component system LytT family response regulator
MSGVQHATNPAAAIAPTPSAAKFWKYNALFWAAYAGALMIPWLDRYSVLDMLPNKIVIAATGVAVTAALRGAYRPIWSDGIPRVLKGVLSVVVCLVGAIAFDTTVIAVTQGPDAIPVRFDGWFGAILQGVPTPGRVGQYVTLLVAWSLGHHLLTRSARPLVAPVAESEPAIPTSESTLSVSGTTVRARDGNRTILLERDEIDWIAADGDYVRLNCGARKLLIRATMKQSGRALAASGFVRVHRSAIVNPRHVREIARDGNDHVVVLRNGTRIRTGRSYEHEVALLTGRV